MAETESEFASRIDRDSLRRSFALVAAVLRAGQDGGLEGGIDVLALAEFYNSWLMTGKTDLKEKPVLEKFKNEEGYEERSKNSSRPA